MSCYIRVKNWVRHRSTYDNFIGHLLKMLYCLFRSPLIQVVTNIVFTVFLAFTSSKLDSENNFKTIMTILIVSVIYLLILLLHFAINNHISGKQDDVIWFQDSLKKIMFMNTFSSNKLHTLNKEVFKQAQFGRIISLDHTKSIISFQQVAFNVCNEIHELLTKLNIKNSYITVYQQFIDNNRSYCKMIAYHNSHSRIPDSFEEEYVIDKSNNVKKHLHTKIFERDSSKFYILSNRDEIARVFVINEASKEREEGIHQYIGIPYRVNKTNEVNIAFLLQIDVDEENALGNGFIELKEKVNNIFLPFVNLLAVAYEQDKLLESYCRSMHILNGRESEVERYEEKAK